MHRDDGDMHTECEEDLQDDQRAHLVRVRVRVRVWGGVRVRVRVRVTVRGRVRGRGRVWGRVRVWGKVRVKRVRTEPESRSGSGRIMSSHSMRYVYMRVAARCVYMVLCGCVHAPATSHGGMWPRSVLPHLEVKCCRLIRVRVRVRVMVMVRVGVGVGVRVRDRVGVPVWERVRVRVTSSEPGR